MKPITKNIIQVYALGVMLTSGNIISAQKTIVISDSLNAHAEMLKVKMGAARFGKIWKFRFGDYEVVSSKLGWAITSSKGNFFNTKTESKSTQKFSFVLTNKENDSAKVNAAKNISTQNLNQIELLPHFSWGNDELLRESVNFSAYITINGDTANTWALLMKNERGTQTEGKYEALLTNGDRKILIFPTSSNKNGGDNRSLPALGYEFMENNQSLCALQYWGGGMLGTNKNMIWLNKDIEAKMKLALSAAMTAVLEEKTNEQDSL